MRTLFLCIALSFAAPAKAQEPSLVLHYKLDEPLGTTILAESSGAGVSAVGSGSCRLGQLGAAPGTSTSAEFTEAGAGYASFPDGPNISNLRNDLTVTAWVKPKSYGPIGLTRILSNDNSSWGCGLMTNGLRFTTLGILDYDLNGVVAPLDTWSHVAYVMDANNDVTFYLNGVNVGTVTGSTPAGTPNADWVIGGMRITATPHEWFDGNIDDLQLYSGSLTDEDIAALYASPGSTLSGGGGGAGYCFGDGSGSSCPCGNASLNGGCANGTGDGATLSTSGFSSLSNDTLVLRGGNLIPNQPGLYFQGNNAINAGSGNAFGDGLRCAGGGVVRLQVRFASATGESETDTSLSAIGQPVAGDVKRYQLWYRDPVTSPCGAQFNLSNGVEITWAP